MSGCSYSLDRCGVKVQDDVSDTVEIMATTPIFRGFSDDWACQWDDWCFIGNGREQLYAKKLRREYRAMMVEIPEEMMMKLGPSDLIRTCKLVRQQVYICRSCHLPI
jgi:hypothetical protein